MKIFVRLAFILSAAALVAGCAALRQPEDGTLPIGAPDAMPHAKHRTMSCPCVYVANSNDSVTVYQSGASGNVKPIQEIRGPNTGLSHPHDVTVDGSGNVYVVNIAPTAVTVYAAGAAGNAAPIETIGGSNTGLVGPTGIAIESNTGDVYVSNVEGGRSQKGSITIYAAGSNGNVAPIGVIQGSKTGLDHPNCLALDANGNVAVTNSHGYVTFYAAGSTGNVAPARTIAGAATELKDPTQAAFDSSLDTYVANARGASVTVYAPDASGNVAPIREIRGHRTNVRAPFGAAVDAAGNVYAASGIGRASRITVFAPGSNGDVRPVRTIKGSRTGLEYPRGIAIH